MKTYNNDFVLTIDVDWAPDWMLEYIASILLSKGVKATWFVTHTSPVLDLLRSNNDLFEVGIHPNCLPGSIHGTNEDDVMKYMKDIAPEAVSMRTHALYQSSPFLHKASMKYGIKIDVSLFLPRTPNLIPHCVKWYGIQLWRIPYFWEDDSEFFETLPIWNLSDSCINCTGLKVFDFHPVHIILNSSEFDTYEKLKNEKPVQSWSVDYVKPHINNHEGTQTLFLELIDFLSSHQSKMVKQIIL